MARGYQCQTDTGDTWYGGSGGEGGLKKKEKNNQVMKSSPSFLEEEEEGVGCSRRWKLIECVYMQSVLDSHAYILIFTEKNRITTLCEQTATSTRKSHRSSQKSKNK